MITPRPYADADMPRLQTAVAEWIAEAGRVGCDHIGELPHRVYENLRGRRPVGEVVHVWEDAEGLAGLGVTTRFGNAFDVFTAPRLRGTEDERTMIRHAYETTGRLAPADAGPYVLTDVWDADAMRIGQLERLGFERFRIWDDVNERGLGEPVPEAAVPDGFVLRAARRSDAEGLAEARNASFGEDWTGESYGTRVMDKPGYDADREIVAVAPDGRIAAYTVYWTDARNRLGHFEPVGTHADFRRRGLARAVMLEAMRRMRDGGVRTVTVNHNAENEAARRLYLGLGFTKAYETYGYRKPRTT